MTTRLAQVLLPVLSLAACVPSPDALPPAVDGPAANACGADELQDLVGQPRAAASDITFAVPVRIIEPGMAVTMDYRADRLNVEIGRDARIARIFCG